MKKQLLLLLGVTLLFTSLNGGIIYVNPSASGANDGTSWTNAFTNLSTALNAALSDDELWVTQGIYKPQTLVNVNNEPALDPRMATFHLRENVKLYGGFLGTETLREQRNWNAHITILSGDIDNNDVDANGDGIIESVDNIRGKNAYHVVFCEANDSSVIDGIIITAGYANSSKVYDDSNQCGGGLFLKPHIISHNQTLRNIIFRANYSQSVGGAFYIYTTKYYNYMDITTVIDNCGFYDNVSQLGGAIFMSCYASSLDNIYSCSLEMSKCEFARNEAYERGGALFLANDYSTIDSCTFLSNKVIASNNTSLGSGGAVFLYSSSARFNNCTFSQNVATGTKSTNSNDLGGGGAVCITATSNDWRFAPGSGFTNCIFYKNVTGGNNKAMGGAVLLYTNGWDMNSGFTNCMFYKNSAQNNGGAVANVALNNPVVFFGISYSNCTFTENHSNQEGGAMYNVTKIKYPREMIAISANYSILWNNTALVDSTAEVSFKGLLYMSYCIVKGGLSSGDMWVNNIINADPLFKFIPLSYNTIGATLKAGSPAINASGISLPPNRKDLLGNPRTQGGITDLGAFEYQGYSVSQYTDVQVKELKDVSVSPIPAKDYVVVSATNQTRKEVILISIYNMNGQLMSQDMLLDSQYEKQIGLSGFSSGIYLLKMSSMDGKYQKQEKIIIK